MAEIKLLPYPGCDERGFTVGINNTHIPCKVCTDKTSSDKAAALEWFNKLIEEAYTAEIYHGEPYSVKMRGIITSALLQPDYTEGGVHEFKGKLYSRRKLEEENVELVKALEIGAAYLRAGNLSDVGKDILRTMDEQLAKHKAKV
jgi:hypothetical protein